MSGGPRIGFCRHLRADVVRGDAVYLFSERDVTVVQGEYLEELAPLLDGSRDLAGLVRDAPEVPPDRVRSVLADLAGAGLVTARTPTAEPEPAAAYWEAAGLDPRRAEAAGTVEVIAVGDVDPRPLRTALEAAGLTIQANPDLTVVACADYLAAELSDVDRLHRSTGRPWLLTQPGGSRLWIGPFFDGTGPGCWHCLATRLWGNRRAEAHVQAALSRSGHADRPAATLPPLAAAAGNLVAVEVAKWLAGYRYAGQRAVWTLDSFDLTGRHHPVRPRPQCPHCGDPSLVRERAWRPVVLDGCGCTPTPAELLDRYDHLVSPVTGLVREIVRDPRGPAQLNSFHSGPVAAGGAASADQLRAAHDAGSGGKGTTTEQAQLSALCEALERHAGTVQGDEARVPGTFAELRDRAIHPDLCQLYHVRQFRDRHRWNAQHGTFQFVCDPFDETAPMSWTPVWSLGEQRHRLLPTGLLYYGEPTEYGRTYVRADSNGTAAGATLTHAVLSGLWELVERDAVALWWYNRTRHPAVDLDSFAEPWLNELREAYAGIRREVWALDVTSDLGVPVIVALSRRVDKPAEDITFGFGCHADARTALRHALAEMNQLTPAVAEIAADSQYPQGNNEATRWWRTATARNQPYLRPDPAVAARRPVDYVPCDASDPADRIAHLRVKLTELGMDVLVLDQTRPDVDLPVAKVIVPGLRSFWARFAPGRLYDVPVRLGRLATPTRYEDLNPVPLFV